MAGNTWDTEVAYVDFRGELTRPSSINDFIELASKVDARFSAAVATAQGVIHPWYIVILDTQQGVNENREFFLMLARSTFGFKIITILDTSADHGSNAFSITLPDALIDLGPQIKFLLVSDIRGVKWKAGTHSPTGVVHWDKDPDGSLSLGVIADVLREHSVFDKVFEALQSTDASVWAVGTRQVWMGKLSGELTQDAFLEVGNEVVSGSTWAKAIDEPPTNDLLVGTAMSENVIEEGKPLSSRFKNITTQIGKLRESFGLATRRGVLSRLADSPTLQRDKFAILLSEASSVSTQVMELVHSIDATNGIDKEELRQLKNLGVDLYEVATVLGGHNLENNFIDQVLQLSESSIGLGHSVESVRFVLSELLQRIRPHDKQETHAQIEEKAQALVSALEIARAANEKPPRSLPVRVGRSMARVLRLGWVRYVLGFVYLWVVSAGIAELITSDQTHGFIPWPGIARELLHLTAVLLCIVLLLLFAATGLLIMYADAEGRKWGRRHQLDGVARSVADLKMKIIEIAVNDWASYDTRTRVHRILSALESVLGEVSSDVLRHFVEPFENLRPEEFDDTRPNPEVRQDLNAKAQGKAFKYVKEIKDILKIDLSSMIAEVLQQHSYRLKTKLGGQMVPRLISVDLESSLSRYVRDGRNFGLLYERLSVDGTARAMRKELARKIWEDPALVDDALRTVVLMESPVELVTYVRPEDLTLLSSEVRDSREIRFIPAFASKRFQEVANQSGSTPNFLAIDGMSAAGVVRVTPLRGQIVDEIPTGE